MKNTIAAIYENGVFRPLKSPRNLRDRDEVDIIIVKENQPLSDCIGILSNEAADEMSAVIEREFEKVDPNDWK